MPQQTHKFRLKRVLVALLVVLVAGGCAWLMWEPGLRVTDGRHDRGRIEVVTPQFHTPGSRLFSKVGPGADR